MRVATNELSFERDRTQRSQREERALWRTFSRKHKYHPSFTRADKWLRREGGKVERKREDSPRKEPSGKA
jgi:hypothetical protein